MTGESDVDVVIVTHNSARTIAACLDSLVGDERIASITVVDNASTDETVALVHERARILRFESNLGFGAGANRGAAVATTPYVCFLNPDLSVVDRAIGALAQFLDDHESVALVGPKVQNPDGSTYQSARSFPHPVIAAGHAILSLGWPQNPFSRKYRQTDLTNPDWISGTAMLIRRTAFEGIGGFDETYFMYVEDVDLCWRLRRAGHGIGYCSAATVTHEIGGSSAGAPLAVKQSLLVSHHRSAWRFARKTTSGREAILLPFYGLALAARLAIALAQEKYRSISR